jgi:hypothetical protein
MPVGRHSVQASQRPQKLASAKCALAQARSGLGITVQFGRESITMVDSKPSTFWSAHYRPRLSSTFPTLMTYAFDDVEPSALVARTLMTWYLAVS